jgi:ribonuclease HI
MVPISTVSVVSEDAAPVDISIETGKHVIASKNTGYKTSHEPEQHIKHIATGLTTNAKDLILHHVNMTVDTEDLRNSIIDGRHFEVATDGGFDPTSGVSTYGWVISLDKQVVAMGRGPAAAHPRLAESFRAEGFGIASAASFLKILIQNFNINTNDFTWRLYVDNQAMIKRMESYRTTIPHSRWNLRPDADITNRANEQITGIPVQYIHVKSHQDNQNPKELGFDAELNIMADELATRQRRLMTEPVITG